MLNDTSPVRLGRRACLRDGTLVLTAASLSSRYLLADEQPAAASPSAPDGVRVGLMTDLHYADKPPAGTRHYRETLAKFAEAAQQFEADKPAFVVELGDFIDAADSVDTELGYLSTINREFSQLTSDRHYVLGNHCVDTLTKEEFLGAVGQKQSYGSFDRGGIHFVMLDACFRSDGQPYGRRNFEWTDANIPAAELDWLAADLQATSKPVVVFAHQRLDVSTSHGVKNNAQVRAILEAAGNVLAVFQGHSHQNDLKEIGGIHYCTLVAMVEGGGVDNNGYARLDITPDGTLELTGFRRQQSRRWNRT
jgi:alkaline phosphatase